MSLTLFDFIVIAIIVVSAVLAMVRGFVREILSVASWVIAAVAAYYLYEPLRGVIQPYIDNETLGTVISVAIVFIVVLVITSYITMKIADFVIDSRIGSLDRLLGFLFGAVRGLLLVVVAFSFFVWLVEDQPDWIANAASRSILANLGETLASVLPDDIEAELVARLQGEEFIEPAAEEPAEDPFNGLLPAEEEPIPPEDNDQLERIINANPP